MSAVKAKAVDLTVDLTQDSDDDDSIKSEDYLNEIIDLGVQHLRFETTIPGPPAGTDRPRACFKTGVIHPTNKQKKYLKTYTQALKQAVHDRALDEDKPRFFLPKETPVEMKVTFYLRRPNEHFINRKRQWTKIKKKFRKHYPTVQKDVDNFAKMIMDASNKVLHDDDKQVIKLTALKLWHSSGACEGCIHVKVQDLNTSLYHLW